MTMSWRSHEGWDQKSTVSPGKGSEPFFMNTGESRGPDKVIKLVEEKGVEGRNVTFLK